MIGPYFNPAWWFVSDSDPVTGEARTPFPGVVDEVGRGLWLLVKIFAGVVGVFFAVYVISLFN